MPFIDSQNLVVEKDVLPSITQQEKNDKQNYPDLSSLILLQGGQGGAFGEKSYKPKVVLANADLQQSYDFNEAGINKCSTTEIKSENDCGYAINFKTDASNQCDFTLGEYDPYNNLNIYTPSQILPFSYLYTGGVSSSNQLGNGDYVGDFILKTNFTADWFYPVLDTELNLNKYYLELRNAADIQKPFYLEKSINFGSAVDSSIFVFYVAQTDLVSGYATYNTGIINFPNNKNGIAAVTGGFYDTLFSVNDFISIEHPSGYYNAKAQITAKNASTNVYTFKITESGNFPRTNSVSFPLGSSVSISTDIQYSNKLSVSVNNDVVPSPTEGYNGTYSDEYNGFQFRVEKKVTTNHKELSNSLSFSYDKKLFNKDDKAIDIEVNYSFPRIGNRKYMQDQYGTDLVKNQIKNKSKFNIFYHGVETKLSQSNDNTSQAASTYSCGNAVSSFVSNKQITKDILGPLSYYGKTTKLIIGTPVTNIGSGLGVVKSSYYSNRIYEVLIYTDLRSSDIPKVLTGLSKKYSQKTNFSSPVEFQTSDMYYSTTDKINILGKIKKTST